MKKTTTFVSILFQVMLSVPRHNLALFREWVTIYTYSKASWGFAGVFFLVVWFSKLRSFKILLLKSVI